MLIDPNKLPHDRDGLKDISFSLPRLERDSPDSCPVGFASVKQYVEVESASFDSSSLKWCRTVDVDDVHYWVWGMDDLGDLVYVYVEEYEGCTLTGLNPAGELSLEQFIVYEYLRNQFDRKK